MAENQTPSSNDIALALIKHFEGCRLTAYVLSGESWATIGWGHTIPFSEHGKIITQADADALLASDLATRDADLKDQLGIAIYSSLTPNQLGATLSFKYNCKPTLFDNSTFLMLLRLDKIADAQNEFKRWVYGEGHVALPGLVSRRSAEAFVFSGGSIDELEKVKHWFQN